MNVNARARRWLQSALLLGSLALALVLILLKGPLAPMKVETVSVAHGDLQPALFGVGTVEARYRYHVGPLRTGRLLTLKVDHGDRVEAGQLLGRMDPVDLPQRLQAAAFTADKLAQQMAAARARLKEARSRHQLALKEAQRYQRLAAKGQISREAADARDTEARTTAEAIQAAQAELAALRHEHQRALADLKALRAQLEALELRSPAAAVVITRKVEPGSVVTAGTPVLELADPASYWVRTRIEQQGSQGLALGLPATIELRQQPGRPWAGKVARVELIADDLTEERWVDVAFDQPLAGLAIGSLANVTIHLPKVEHAAWVPAAALDRRGGSHGVWLLREGRARFQPVKVGIRTLDGKVQLLSDLPADSRIIVHAGRPLSEGCRVEESHP